MVYYLEELPPFVSNQGLPEDERMELVEFALPYEWQKQLLVQGYDYTSKEI